MDDQVRLTVENGVAWAMREYNMTEEDVLELLSTHGKAPCSCCARIQDKEKVGEDGVCNRCVCRECG